jgi:predicted MPP superfamily phosphohydrolase
MFWLWLLLAIALGCGIWGIAIERHLYRVREAQIENALPEGSSPIRVLHLSDIHLAPWQKRKARWVAELTRLNPDLVINTGDNMSHRNVVPQTLAMLGPLMRHPGVFVNGSNDYHAPTLRNPLKYLFSPSAAHNGASLPTAEFTDALEAGGWLNLNNRSGTLKIGGTRLGFLGLDDPHDDLADIGGLPRQASEVLGADLVIGVAHAPYLSVIEQMTLNGAEVIFGGHTHGGQVCLPLLGALVTNCDLPARYAKGLSGWEFGGKRSVLNVCAGLGTSIFAPVRFFCLPEVRLITLLPRQRS